MKRFNLEEYLKNPSKKVVTRDGLNARIICVDRDHVEYPIVALVKSKYGEAPVCYTKDGEYHLNNLDDMDLLFAPERKHGWINIYKNAFGVYLPSPIYQTKEEAEEEGKISDGYVTTAKIEWEE